MFRRVIPCLDIKDGRVVKGVKFVNLKDARDPVEAAIAYSKQGADELVFLDIAATTENRKTRLDWVKRVTDVVTVPFCVGGGIRNIGDMQDLFALDVDKISINTAAVKNPELIKEAAKKFGRKKIVVAIDAKSVYSPQSTVHSKEQNNLSTINYRLSTKKWDVLIIGGEESADLDVVEWAKKVEQSGAGEILLTSKDADGTKQGYDLEMTRAVAEAVNIPVIASGGAGNLEHLYEVLTEGKADAVLAASIFHYGEYSIREAKEYLKSKGISVKM